MAAEVAGGVPVGEVAGVPLPVVRALGVLRGVERERAARARRWPDARVCEHAGGERALSVVEAAETVKAWADSVALGATARVVQVLDHEDDRHAAPAGHGRDLAELVDAAVSELAAATGLGEREVSRRVAMAVADPDRVDPLVRAMRTRGVPLFRAVTVFESTCGIEVEDLPEVYATVLADRRDGTPPSPAQLRQRLRTQVLRHDAGCDERARTTGLRERTAWVLPRPDGTATLAATGDAGRCAAAYHRVDAIARALKAAGHGAPTVGTAAAAPGTADHDERTLAQLRSDVLIDLVLYGHVPAPEPAPAAAGPLGAVDQVAGRAADRRHPVGACDLPVLGQLPPAVTHITLALSTLLGLDDAPGAVRGVGAVTAAHARELATAAGSVWRRLVTDPLTGRAVTLDPRRYRPPTSVADDVRVRDGVCRGVGCTLDAWHCDGDHVIPWQAGGPTTATNLASLHRRHHQRKTRGRWRARIDPDGTLHWTSPLGRHYLTEPHVHSAPDPSQSPGRRPPPDSRCRPAPAGAHGPQPPPGRGSPLGPPRPGRSSAGPPRPDPPPY